jgi:flavin-dependent dehydrogenase
LAGLSGPEVRQIGLLTGDLVVVADMPAFKPTRQKWGRACRREVLDTVLLDAAAHAGVKIFQPATAIAWRKAGPDFVCQMAFKQDSLEVRSRVLIAAHGSWDHGTLPTQPKSAHGRPSDLLAFKAHFRQSKLPAGLMPLLAFPGGYGGIVHCEDNCVSISCCIRRDQLQRCRTLHPGQPAPQAVLGHILQSCTGVRDFLDGAQLDQTWLSAGPIRPGVRSCGGNGLFLVGNAAGEAHPVIAEGISMALQSAWLLARCLVGKPDVLTSRDAIQQVQADYSRVWKQSFDGRIRFSTAVANWAMRPPLVDWTGPVLRRFPSILTLGARLSGKTRLGVKASH